MWEDESQVMTSSTWVDGSSVRRSPRSSSDKPLDTSNLPAVTTVKEVKPGGEENPEKTSDLQAGVSQVKESCDMTQKGLKNAF